MTGGTITLDILLTRVEGLAPEDLRRWVAEGHVRPDAEADAMVFHEIDVERLRLILDLRDRLAVDEAALPVVLSLLDQVYALRRQLRALGLADTGLSGGAG